MNIEERVTALETEFRTTRDELKQILLDLRTYLMEAQTPFQANPPGGEYQAGSEPEKGVEPHGNG